MNLGPRGYQADMLPTELSWLGIDIFLVFRGFYIEKKEKISEKAKKIFQQYLGCAST